MEVEFFVEASSFLSMGRGILVNLNNLLIVVFLWPRCDSWKWDYSDGGFFTIHSCYSLYALKLLPSLVLVEARCHLLGLLWESLDPPKTFVSALQMLLSGIATFANLCIRGVIVGNDLGGCVWCPLVVELKDHLFCVVILQGGFGFPFLGGLVCLRPYLEMCSHF